VEKPKPIKICQEAPNPIFYQYRYPDDTKGEGLASLRVEGDDWVIIRLNNGEEYAFDFNDFMDAFLTCRTEIIQIKERLLGGQ